MRTLNCWALFGVEEIPFGPANGGPSAFQAVTKSSIDTLCIVGFIGGTEVVVGLNHSFSSSFLGGAASGPETVFDSSTGTGAMTALSSADESI